jgi:hypothetical protein
VRPPPRRRTERSFGAPQLTPLRGWQCQTGDRPAARLTRLFRNEPIPLPLPY